MTEKKVTAPKEHDDQMVPSKNVIEGTRLGLAAGVGAGIVFSSYLGKEGTDRIAKLLLVTYWSVLGGAAIGVVTSKAKKLLRENAFHISYNEDDK
jgi:hypothetical protein